MNGNSIKTYTSKEAIAKVFTGIFSKYQSFIKTKDSAVLIKFLKYEKDQAVYEIKGVNVEKKSVIFSRDKKNNSIYAIVELIKNENNNTYFFMPVKVQIIVTPRKEERMHLDPENTPEHRLKLINLMSEYILRSSLDLYKKKIHGIEETIESKLRNDFKYVRVYMIHHGTDIRMDYFRLHMKPIIIKNITTDPQKSDRDLFEYYKREIMGNDQQLKLNKNIISEITIPILYNMKIPYGFIQINSNEELQESSVRLIKNTALSVNNALTKQNIFPHGEEHLSVYDISKSGIGISFSDKKCIKYFSEKQLVLFDMVLPGNKKVNVLALVSHISIKGSIYKVGCKIIEIDALSEVFYDEYLESIGLKL